MILLIKVIPSESRYLAEHGWLTSRFSFSFAEYYDPANLHFGPLRVFNDDIIQPGTGFDMHPHADMEIVTYVVEGSLEHRDSMGNIGIINAGELQRITAGTGMFHAEYNPSQDAPVHLFQMWFLPQQRGLTPSWEEKSFTKEAQRNRLLPVVSGEKRDDTLFIHQDMTLYLSTLDAGMEITHQQAPGRRIYLFVIKGDVSLDEQHHLRQGDAARITGLDTLAIRTSEGAELLLIDLP